jgi:hypothetical protein
MKSRIQVLTDLLDYSYPLEQMVLSLRQFPWDAETVLVILHRRHIIQLLERYLGKELANGEVEAWANAIEGREDIDYESEHEDILQEIIHILANPVLTESLDINLAEHLIKTLQ